MESGFVWTIPLIQCVFGSMFLALHRAGAARVARTWGISYLLNAGAFTVSLGASSITDEVATVAADTLFALSIFGFSEALIQRHNLPRMLMIRLPVLALSIVLPLIGTIAGDLRAEVLACDIGYVVQLLVPLLLIRWKANRLADRMMIGCSWAVVVLNLIRMASLPDAADGTTSSSFLTTAYSYLMFADGMISGMMFGAVALATVTTELLERHQGAANVDPLTGLLNRRGFELAARPSQAADRECLFVCDLDHFKRVNDTYGHATGDEVLAAFGKVLRSIAPAGSASARIGGEEFAIFLPNHSRHRAEAVALSLRLPYRCGARSRSRIGPRLG